MIQSGYAFTTVRGRIVGNVHNRVTVRDKIVSNVQCMIEQGVTVRNDR